MIKFLVCASLLVGCVQLEDVSIPAVGTRYSCREQFSCGTAELVVDRKLEHACLLGDIRHGDWSEDQGWRDAVDDRCELALPEDCAHPNCYVVCLPDEEDTIPCWTSR